MAEALIQVGRVAGAFGVRGEVRLSAYTEDPLALVSYRTLLRQDGSLGLTITQGRPAKGGLVCRCLEIETKEQADALRGLRLFVPRASLPEPDEDEFYLTDLVGLRVETPEGAPLGAIKSVQDFGAGDILEITPAEGGPTWYLPFTREAVPQVLIGEGRVVAIKPEEVE
ncbi:16S rRNA processing protein RimM [Caulobacter ginsengisoli]|uniref:Ribosome maturation factor RimM n=1 Tax=Caulobacter ginsengisoli TaxID=400775 RepID=A0ABU0IUH3_9CAUL|nr:ribosome maturation factor RimM [Caulobacter ginsengisoli]MDQ0465668.1 16S rRNA processing protein RimM [Caulobacter ginsengisoli]